MAHATPIEKPFEKNVLVNNLDFCWGLVPGFVSGVLGIVFWVLGLVCWVLGLVFWVLGLVF